MGWGRGCNGQIRFETGAWERLLGGGLLRGGLRRGGAPAPWTHTPLRAPPRARRWPRAASTPSWSGRPASRRRARTVRQGGGLSCWVRREGRGAGNFTPSCHRTNGGRRPDQIPAHVRSGRNSHSRPEVPWRGGVGGCMGEAAPEGPHEALRSRLLGKAGISHPLTHTSHAHPHTHTHAGPLDTHAHAPAQRRRSGRPCLSARPGRWTPPALCSWGRRATACASGQTSSRCGWMRLGLWVWVWVRTAVQRTPAQTHRACSSGRCAPARLYARPGWCSTSITLARASRQH
jgi:hypothetical protein